eukprot:750446-Hanusia_phi.AAC.6
MELMKASTANYSFVTAVGELADNSLQYVLRKQKHESKNVSVILDSVKKTLVLKDNGVGCDDALKMLELGSKQEKEVYDECKSFLRYVRGDFSRFGVGAKNACKSLGETYVVSSKTKGSVSKQVVRELDPKTWEAEQCIKTLGEGEEATSSFCSIEIQNFKFDQFFCKDGAFSSEALELCLKNLRAMYYLYLEGQNSGAKQLVNWLLRQSEQSCLKGRQKSLALKKYRDQWLKFRGMLKRFMEEEYSSSDQIDFEFQVLLEGSDTPQVHKLSQSTCCIDRMLVQDSKDCFPIYIEVKDEHSDRISIVTGAVFYFPRKDEETVPTVDQLLGPTSQENRRFMTFWMGRWLPGEYFFPEFMKYQKERKSQAPERCYSRTFGIIFVDRGIEPEANKWALNVNAASLMRMKDAFAKEQLETSYDLWLKECHLNYDVEVSFQGDQPKYIEREDVSEHNKVTLCGQTYVNGDLVELSKDVKEKRGKEANYYGKIMRFLQDENFCKNRSSGKVEVEVLQSNNRLKVFTFGIPTYSMKLITSKEYKRMRDANELNIVWRVIPILDKEIFVAGSSIPFPEVVCQNSMKSVMKNAVLPRMRAILRSSRQDPETTFDIKDGHLEWHKTFASEIFTRADDYILDLKPAEDELPFESDSLSFKIVPAAMAKIVLDRFPATCAIGKDYSCGLRVLDKYKNIIALTEKYHKLDLVLDATSAQKVEFSFKPTFGQSEPSTVELCITNAQAGTYPASIVVANKRNVQQAVKSGVLIKVEHGSPGMIQAKVPLTGFTNYAKFDPIDIAIRDSSANLCHACPPDLLVTSPDLLFSDRKRWERGHVHNGISKLQPYCTSSLFSCAPAAAVDKPSIVSEQVIKQWQQKILDQNDPIGVFHEKHGFFQKGDCILIQREQELSDKGHRKTCPKFQSCGTITSFSHLVDEAGNPTTGFTVKYLEEVSTKSSRLREDRRDSRARLLRPGDEFQEDLHPSTIHGRCFVFHTSLRRKLDQGAMADNVFFCDSDEYPRSLQANLDMFYETDETLLHKRLTSILKSSGTPRRTKLYRAGEELIYENVAGQERQVEIIAMHDEKISDLLLQISDEANRTCRVDLDDSSDLQVELSWSAVNRFTFNDNQTCELPTLHVQENSTQVVSVFSKQDGHETRLCKYSIHIKVKHGSPQMLKLSIPKLPVTVGETFQLHGEIVDQHGYSINPEGIKDLFKLVGITSFTYRYEEPQDDQDEVQVITYDNANNVLQDEKTLSYITISGSKVVVMNACLLSRPVKGSLNLALIVKSKSDNQNYSLTPVKLDVEPIAGKPSKVCIQQGQIDSCISVPSMSQQECIFRFIAADLAGNNVSASLEQESSMTMTIKHKTYLLQKVPRNGGYFKLGKLPPLRAGEYNAIVGVTGERSIQPYNLPLLVISRDSVTNITMNVQESQKCLEHLEELGVVGAEFLATVEFYTDDQQELKQPQGTKPNVKLFCERKELQIRYGEFKKNRLEVFFTLFDLGTSKVYAKFTETRASYAAERMESNRCDVEVKPADSHADEGFDEEVMDDNRAVREPSVENQDSPYEDESQKGRKEVQKQILSCRCAISASIQRLPDSAKVSSEIQKFYVIPTDISDLSELRESCKRFLQAADAFKIKVQSDLREMEQASETLQNKSAVSQVKLPGACNALGCLSTLFVINHARSSDLQTALSTAFGDELDCVVFHKVEDCDTQLSKICQSSKRDSLNGVALDKLTRLHPAETGVERASDSLKLEKKHDSTTEEKLQKLAEVFFGRLVVFEQFEQASSYCERARPGEMAVGLDSPNRVLFWDGRRKVGSARYGQPRLGLVDAIHSSAYPDLQQQLELVNAIENELQVSELSARAMMLKACLRLLRSSSATARRSRSCKSARLREQEAPVSRNVCRR